MKRLRESKTFWVNFLLVVAGAVGGALGVDFIASNPIAVGYLGSAVGIVNIVLRLLTGKKIEGV